MKLFLISQTINQSYDSFDSAVVVADSKETAKNMHPGGGFVTQTDNSCSWCCSPEDVTVTYLGEAADSYQEPEVVCASFNAG